MRPGMTLWYNIGRYSRCVLAGVQRFVRFSMSFYGRYFRICRWAVRRILPRVRLEGFPGEEAAPVVFVSRHQNYGGMVSVVANIPLPVHVWSLDVLTEKESCRNHYYTYTFSRRYGWPRPLAWLAAYLGGGIIAPLLQSMGVIPVHRGKREIIETFRQSAECIHRGESMLIFPDVEYTDDSPEAGDMYHGFVNLARMVRKQYGETVRFIPLYTSMRTHTIYAGTPVEYDPATPFARERIRIVEALQADMNAMAQRCGDIPADK